MLTIAVVLFALGAAGGITMAMMNHQGKPIPLPLAIIHGVLGASGLVVLLLVVLGGGGGLLTYSLILFILAALGGFVLLSKHLKGEPLPTNLIYVHGGVAVLAFVLLLLVVF